MKHTKAMTNAIKVLRDHGYHVQDVGGRQHALWQVTKADAYIVDTTTTDGLLAFTEKVKRLARPRNRTLQQLLADSERIIEASKRLSQHRKTKAEKTR